MRCKYPNCVTILRKANKDKFCSLHERILYQHDIYYEKRGFYRIIESYKSSKKRDFKEFIPLEDIKLLKESINIIDVFSEDRLIKDAPYILPKPSRIDFSRA